MIIINGPLWFIGALLICGGFAFFLWCWQRERQLYQAWWQKYENEQRQQHEESMRVHDVFMRELDKMNDVHSLAWAAPGKGDRGQA